MAHVTVELRRSHGGEAVETLRPRGADVGGLLPSLENVAYPLLRLIDPFDVTEFSSNQMIGLLPELHRLYGETPEPVLQQVIDLAARSRENGFYLTFIGD